MKIYMHCLTNQDITKQFAYTDEIRRNFFDNAQDQEEISLVGMKSEREQKVRILTATDCRFNANFKYILFAEGSATIGDIVIFYKIDYRKYNFELILKSNPRYEAYKQLFTDPRHLPIFTNLEQLQNNISAQEEKLSEQKFSQTIYYGVPGCGKSHSISAKLRKLGISKSDECNFTKRVVFHPEYTNADFIGQILPETNEEKKVSYPFKAGPFTEILAQAYTHKNQNYALIIEEINRGNAAAIFGELFQLLDRLDKTENESSNDFKYTAGWSSYPVNNDNINKAIQEAYLKSDIEPFLPKEIFEKYKLNVGIRLPPNLSLLATMNTSDQNVFVLDNAFQRRWNMCLVPNKFPEENEPGSAIENQRNAILEGSSVTWESFQTQINQTIAQASKDSGFSSMVDKRLGCWFVKAEKNADGKFVIKEESFKNKILKYLWDDAFKFDRENYFVDADSFEDLQSKVSMSEKNFGIFKVLEFAQNSSKTEEKLESTD